MAPPTSAISFIGLGAMGFGMATNLIREGFTVTGFDVYPPTLDKFQQQGGLTASTSTPAATVEGKDICVCMVATAQQAQSVLLEGDSPAVPALPKGAVIVLCSTVPCAYVQALQAQLEKMGRGDILLVDAPVSGGAARAASGHLSIMVGASDTALSKALPVLQTMSDAQKLYIVKGGVGAGSNMKMCHQVLAANQILSSSEAMGFAQHLGLDLPTFGQTLTQSSGWSWMLENRLPRILHPEFLPLVSATTIILKDTSIITSEARRTAFPTLMCSTAEQIYFSSFGVDLGSKDDSSMIVLYNHSIGKPELKLAATSIASEKDKADLVISLLRAIHLCSAVEALTFAHHVGLDLQQVFELCINAAGGSTMLSKAGPQVMNALSGNYSMEKDDSGLDLQVILKELTVAAQEAQSLKMPLHLGNQAMSILRAAESSAASRKKDFGLVDLIGMWKPSLITTA